MHLSSRSLRAICWQGFQALSDVHIACPSLTSVRALRTTTITLSALHMTTITLSALFMHYQHCWCTAYALFMHYQHLFMHYQH